MTAKDKYRALCKREISIPIFSRDWWLDCVCGSDNWQVVLVEENNEIRASLPFFMPCNGLITMPFYTQTMGPWIAPASCDSKYNHTLALRQSICKELIEQLPSFSSYLQNCSTDITDWLPFYWKDFTQTTRYTYVLPDIHNTELLYAELSSNIRRNIRRATNIHELTIKKGIELEELFQMQKDTFNRQQISFQGDKKTLDRLIKTCRERNQGDIWGAYDKAGKLHAAVFVVWQDSSAWYIAGGGNPELRQSGAHSLLLWECIQYVSQFTNRFDFEGSMIPGVERFFREFGGIQMPYFSIQKGSASLADRIQMKLKRYFNL